MSCRVFKRTMEFAMLDALIEQCQKRDITTLTGTYNPTAKNKVVAHLYDELGFTQTNLPYTWNIQVRGYEHKNHYIRYSHD